MEYFRCKDGHEMFVFISKLRPYPRQHHLPRNAKLYRWDYYYSILQPEGGALCCVVLYVHMYVLLPL